MIDKGAAAVIGVCLSAIFFVLGMLYGTSLRDRDWQHHAVKIGAAEWEPSERGTPRFKWKNIEAEDETDRLQER